MTALRIGAGFLLVVLCGGLGWIVFHWRKIRREMIRDEAMPRSAPAANLLVLLGAVIVVFISLLTYLVIRA